MKRTPILVENGRVHVTVGDAHASAPIELLEPLIRLLEASVTFVSAEPSTSKPAAAVSAPKAPTAAPKAAAVAPKRAKGKPAPAADDFDAPRKYQRKSRKPVAPAIIAWMEANPGWKSEGTLLAAVTDNNMTDADPKRALMIALGKARGKTFDTNGRGHWKLAGDDAGPAPRGDATLKSKAARGKSTKAAAARKKAAPRTTKAAVAAPKAKAKPKKRGTRKTKTPVKKRLGLALVDWMELNPGWRDVDELLDAVIENEMTDANPSLALRITLGKGVGTGTFVNDGENRWKLAGDTTKAEEAKAVLVKGGKGKAKKGRGGAKSKGSKRWNKADGKAVNRARKNLLGLSRGPE